MFLEGAMFVCFSSHLHGRRPQTFGLCGGLIHGAICAILGRSMKWDEVLN